MNMTLAQKQSLQALVEAGAEVATIAYDPQNATGDPEGDAMAGGWVEFQREATANLVQVVYTR